MEIRDLFVAVVALTIGGMMIYSSALDRGWCLEMKIARVIEESKGRASARSFMGWVGSLLVLIGLYLLLAPWGFSFFQKSDQTTDSNSVTMGSMSLAKSK